MARRTLAGILAVVASLVALLGSGEQASSSPNAKPGLDPALLAALQRAAADGLDFEITSGRRTPEHQAQLLRDAVAKYGSEAEARRWVATPQTSAHVSGDAVDIGPPAAADWLAQHSATYGLCRIYDNEPWHFELRPDGCPPTYPDPTYDPRMQ